MTTRTSTAMDPGSLVQPMDSHNQVLLSNVHPPEWENPTPAERYNLVVIGAGAGGLVSAIGAAGLGAKVALVERNLLGGDCLNVGCVPSKALIRAARAVADVRKARDFGVQVSGDVSVDFAGVMQRMRRLRADISVNDGVGRLTRAGVDVFIGHGKFTGPATLQVGDDTLRFSKAIIAAGARAAAPPIPGLKEAGYLTNEKLFWLTQLPRRLAIIGAGPIGCEMAQAFARFGSAVSLLETGAHILGREDAGAAAIVQHALAHDGVNLMLGTKIKTVRSEGDEKVILVDSTDGPTELRVDEILVGVGRQPNAENLGLDAAGVAFDAQSGVTVDDRLRTSNPRIFAVGDICFKYKFTHVADALARIALQNALFMGRAKASALTIPWCTYTDPEVAHVGMYEKDAQEKGIETDTIMLKLDEIDRAILDGESEGFLKVHLKKGTDKILGATLVAGHAGEMISEISATMMAGGGMKSLAKTIHPYPTQADVMRRAGDAYNRTRLTPLLRKIMGVWLKWSR